jgi:flavin reductase (DIM6/NTAB) family NADH-FMN oxidoreductase RutF
MKNGNGNGTLQRALGLIPESIYVLTSATDHARCGMLVSWVQRCSVSPPMVMLALPIGQAIEPTILESRSFALCQLPADNRFLLRRFANDIEAHDDPFYATSSRQAPSGAPIIDSAVAWLDCALVRHLDLESGCGIYIGEVKHGAVLNDDSPSIRIGFNGDTPIIPGSPGSGSSSGSNGNGG